MAVIDTIQSAYRTHLGRDASPDELEGWTSGRFGGGNETDWVAQIANSGEAQARKAPVVGTTPNVSTPQYTATNIYDPEYRRTGYGTAESGLGEGGVNNPAYHGIGSSDFEEFSKQLGGAYNQYLGRSARPDELSNWWSGAFGYGSGLSGLPSFTNAIRNSGEAQNYHPSTTGSGTGGGTTTNALGGDVQAWLRSVLTGASSPQALAALEPQLTQRGIRLQKDSDGNIRGRLYMPDGSALDVVNQWGAPWAFTNRGAGGGGGTNLPSSQYSDPYTKLLEDLLKNRIGNLGPVNDPNRAAYEASLQNRANQLRSGNEQLAQQMAYLQKRFTDLQGSGFTGAENEVIKTGALDPIEQDRQQAKQALTNRLAAKGHKPGSGVFEAMMQELDKNFDAIRGTTQTQLSTNELARRENRNQRAEAISGALASIPDERNRELLDVMAAIDKLSQLTRNEDDSRAREGIQYGGVLSDLGPQRLSLAMQAAGAGGVTPSSLGSLLTQIAGLNQTGQAYNAQNSNGLAEMLGNLAAIIEQRQRQYGLG